MKKKLYVVPLEPASDANGRPDDFDLLARRDVSVWTSEIRRTAGDALRNIKC
jgi:hypothetical protein